MTAQAPADGLIAGKYRLVRLLGRGGMGSVWEARHETLGSRVAIKFIEGELLDNPEARARFETEARAAAQIDSKHAIRVDDYGVTEDGRPYIIMEVLEGEGLDKRVQRLGHLTMQDTARIVEQVCRALEKAHSLGIVHRDLKPENIFLARRLDDHEEVAKVLDFGIAKMISGGHASAKTRTGVMMGTPEFMSPEQVHGLDVDYRTDLWAMGVIAYRCITGSLPFSGVGPMDIGLKIVQGPIPVPSQVAPHTPPAFDAWFGRAVARDATRRFANARELAESLSMLAVSTASIRASAPSTAELQTHPVNQTAYAPTIATPGVGRTSAGLAAPPRSTQRSNGALIGALAGVVVLIGLVAGFATYSRFSGDRSEPATAATRPAYSAPASAASAAQAASTATSIPISALPMSRPTGTVATSVDPRLVVNNIPQGGGGSGGALTNATQAAVGTVAAVNTATGPQYAVGTATATATVATGSGATGQLTVISLPPCDAASVDGVSVGQCPIYKKTLPVGSHVLRLVTNSPHIEKVITAVIVADQITKQTVNLMTVAATPTATATAAPANMNCNPPYVVDASGTKKWKPECL